MSTPILAKSIAKKLNAKFILAINVLDSYKERNIDEYLRLLKQYDIYPDECWIDAENIDKLLNQIYYLIDKGYIYEAPRKILNCECKKVEIPFDNLQTINTTDSCFYEKSGNYYCKHCNNICHIDEIDSLIFNPKLIPSKDYTFFPEFINKDIKTFCNTILNNEIIISRIRNTGINLEYQGKKYNLDVDFLWEVYLSLFPNNDKIVICSNHQLYQLFMVSMLEKCYISGQTIALATPYLNIPNKEKEQELVDRIMSLNIFTILNQKWAKKENVFDEGLLSYINTMNISKKEMLYNILMEKNNEADMLLALKNVLLKEFNLQNANKELKRRRKNV